MNVVTISPVVEATHNSASAISSAQPAKVTSFNSLLALLWGTLDQNQEVSDPKNSELASGHQGSTVKGDTSRRKNSSTTDPRTEPDRGSDQDQSGTTTLYSGPVAPPHAAGRLTGWLMPVMLQSLRSGTTTLSTEPLDSMKAAESASDSEDVKSESQRVPRAQRGVARFDASQFTPPPSSTIPAIDPLTATSASWMEANTTTRGSTQNLAGDAAETFGGMTRSEAQPPGELSFAAQLTDRLVPAKYPAGPSPALKPNVQAVIPGNTETSEPTTSAAEERPISPGKPATPQSGNAQNNDGSDRSSTPLATVKLKAVQKPAEPQDDQPGQDGPNRKRGTVEMNSVVPQMRASSNSSTPATSSSRDEVEARQQISTKSEINSGVRPPPTREISIKLGGDSGGLDLRISDRGGKVQVAVRTSDAELAGSLRSNLDELVTRLERKGFTTETWTPSTTHRVAMTADSSSGGSDDSTWRDQGTGQGRQEHRQQEQREQPRDRRAPQWVEEITQRVSSADNTSQEKSID